MKVARRALVHGAWGREGRGREPNLALNQILFRKFLGSLRLPSLPPGPMTGMSHACPEFGTPQGKLPSLAAIYMFLSSNEGSTPTAIRNHTTSQIPTASRDAAYSVSEIRINSLCPLLALLF